MAKVPEGQTWREKAIAKRERMQVQREKSAKERVAKRKEAIENGTLTPHKKQRKVLMKAGMKVGNLILVRRVREAGEEVSAPLRKRWRVRCTVEAVNDDGTKCQCGKEVTVPEMYLRRKTNPKTDCGEHTSTFRSRNNNEYRIWLMVRERTRNPEHVAYSHYKSRGIDICDEWYDLATGFELFFACVGSRPSKGHTLDRIDNSRGYEAGNIRWATPTQQRANQGDMVAGYSQAQIETAGFTRLQFTKLVSQGHSEHELINKGVKSQKGV